VRAFLKRDSRTGADTPPHPQIFRLALLLPRSLSLFFLSLSLFSSHLCIFLSRSLARSLSRVRPFFRSPFSPVLFLLYAPTSIAAATATATTPIASRSLPHSRLKRRDNDEQEWKIYEERKNEKKKRGARSSAKENRTVYKVCFL